MNFFLGSKVMMSCFDYKEAFKALPGSKESAVRELLSDMTEKDLGTTSSWDLSLYWTKYRRLYKKY